MKAIDVEDLFFAYQRESILKEISFTVEKGEFLGIIGPNGGGKTTLLYLLMGFLKPQSGTIKIFEDSVIHQRTKMGWVPQHFHYDHDFPITALEVVLTGCLSQINGWGNYKKEDEVRAHSLLDELGLKKQKNALISELSGGQLQRILLARALLGNPQMLFLDEPTANVDQEAQQIIYNKLNALKGEVTILMVTHDLRTATEHVMRLLCVEKTLSSFSCKEVCEHFALGLYHPPLKEFKNVIS